VPEPQRMDIERLCAFCRYYDIIVIPNAQGGAGPFCNYHKQFFPEPRRWLANPLKKKPGERTCENWRTR
jgi:hypothetical protein